ncbi:MAG TPA: hypothetical protein VGH97_17865 [Thermoanaerobaculia bacterium]
MRPEPTVRLWLAGAALALSAGLLVAVACASGGGTAAAPAPAATPVPTAAATPRPPVPAARVPDQPYVGTPRPAASSPPYLEIMRLRSRGQTNEQLLAKVRSESVVYTLSTYDIQKLRASGVSEDVIEAMLASGRQALTPTPTPAAP